MTDETQQDELPAIAGGLPAFPEGPPDWPGENQAVSESVLRALRDGSWGKYDGPNCVRLKEALCEKFGFQHALLCSSGTIATVIALRGVNVQVDSEVALAAYDFAGNFAAVDSLGSRPALVDIEADSWCIDSQRLDDSLSDRTSAVIVSHLHGGTAEMNVIAGIARDRGIQIVEDACQFPALKTVGNEGNGHTIGRHSDVLTLSFGGSKLLSAGRGGAVLTNREVVFQRAKVFAQRGNDAYPLSELQAAALIPQLDTLDQHNQQRLASVNQIKSNVDSFWRIASSPSSVYFKLPWLFDPPFEMSRQQMIDALQIEGISADAGFRGFVNRSSRRCRKASDLENSSRAAEKTIVFHHPILLKPADQIQRFADAIEKVYRYFQQQCS